MVTHAFIRSVTDAFQNLKVQSYPREVFKLTKLILVLLLTNAMSKRTFSLLSACKNQLDISDLTKVLSDFINKNDARKNIFW